MCLRTDRPLAKGAEIPPAGGQAGVLGWSRCRRSCSERRNVPGAVVFFFGLSSFSLVFCLVFRLFLWSFVWSFVIIERSFFGLLVFCHNRAAVFGVRCFVKSPVWIGDVQNLDQCSPKRQVKKTKPPALHRCVSAGLFFRTAVLVFLCIGLLP